MTFQEAIKTCLNKYADFNGRASRSEFWWFVLFTVIVGFVIGIIGAIIGKTGSTILSGLVSLALLLPSLAVAVRRLHDVDKSGRWVFISLIPVIGGIWLLVLELTAGNPAPNAYGEPQN